MSMHFKSGGKINLNQLENLGNSIIETDKKNKTLLYKPGVLRLPATISSNFEIEVNDDKAHINVGYIPTGESNAPFGGVAIDKNGRTISITSNQAYVGSLDSDIEDNIKFTNNAWTPARSDDPQLQNFGEVNDNGYQRNSGNYNIPITPNAKNDVYIKYIEVVKQTASSSQEVSGVNYETEYTDGYCIKVVTADVDMTGTEWIYLGQVDASGDNASDPIASNALMQRGYLNGSTVGAEYHAMTNWNVNYPNLSGEYIDLEMHINALGTGVPSATNPHGLSAADIGANVNNTGFTTVSTMTALSNGSYTLSAPILDLSVEGAAEAYDVILIDAENAPEGSMVTVKLPEANINTTAYKYTIKATATAVNATVAIASEINTSSMSNYVDGGDPVPLDDKTFSVLELNAKEPVTLVVGLTNSGYNWWRI